MITLKRKRRIEKIIQLYIEGKTLEDISKKLGLSIKSVEKDINYIIKNIGKYTIS